MKDEIEKTMNELEKIMNAQKEGFDAIITGIEETDSHAFYGVTTYEKRQGLKLTLEIDTKDGETWTEFFGVPKPKGFGQSGIGLFAKKYDQLPKVGQKVKAEIDENGFFRVVL